MFWGQIGPVFCALNRHWSTRHTLQKRGDHLPRTCCFEVNKVSCCYWLKRKYINNSFGCPLIESKAFWALFNCVMYRLYRGRWHRSKSFITEVFVWSMFCGYLFRWTIEMALLIHLFWHYFCYWRHILSRGKFDICNVVSNFENNKLLVWYNWKKKPPKNHA